MLLVVHLQIYVWLSTYRFDHWCVWRAERSIGTSERRHGGTYSQLSIIQTLCSSESILPS